MKNFEYVRAESVEQAVKALGGSNARAIAGGMDLVPTMQENLIPVDRVVNLKTIRDDSMRGVTATADGLTIGALTTLTDIAEHPTVVSDYLALAEAAGSVGSPQIRNVGTIGGNLCQRPRCWYFRHEDYHCLKKRGARCFAAEELADNEYHAVLGGGPCHIVHPSNTATALLALNASVRVVGSNGSRTIALDDFFVLPAESLYKENALQDDELITQITVPAPAMGQKSAFMEMGERAGFDWAIAGAAVSGVVNGGRIRSPRIVLHAVAPIPWRAMAAEQTLDGAALSEDAIRQAAETALSDARPLSQNAYKVPLTKTMVRRALARLA